MSEGGTDARSGLDRTGADATEFRQITEQGRTVREPVLNEAYRRAMIITLYCAGWSYRLIAQLVNMDNEQVRLIIIDPWEVTSRG